jgi:hypothetical protein
MARRARGRRAGRRTSRARPCRSTRQLFPELLLGEAGARPEESGETLFENDGVRLWRCRRWMPASASSPSSRRCTPSATRWWTAAGSLSRAERELDGLVIWHEAPFAVGANLKQIHDACVAGDFERLERTVSRFQQTAMAIKFSPVPVVAAVQGMALGGGCEFAMHARKRVLALESQLGLVEVGVGLIPSGAAARSWRSRGALGGPVGHGRRGARQPDADLHGRRHRQDRQERPRGGRAGLRLGGRHDPVQPPRAAVGRPQGGPPAGRRRLRAAGAGARGRWPAGPASPWR